MGSSIERTLDSESAERCRIPVLQQKANGDARNLQNLNFSFFMAMAQFYNLQIHIWAQARGE